MTETEARLGCPIASCEEILKFVKPHYTGVEIGVFIGTSSKRFLEKCTYMYFIDPFETYEEYRGSENDFVSIDIFLKEMTPYFGRYTLLKQTSASAAGSVPQVDFVYIDGNHDPEFVKQDIKLYWPKIKSGGFISGHDYGYLNVNIDRCFNAPIFVYGDCWCIFKS